MRLIFLIISFFTIIQFTYSQSNKEDTSNTVSIEPLYFVLGTLSDYMGRFHYIERDKQIDRYYSYEKPLTDYLTHYIKTELNITIDSICMQSNRYLMYSDELSKTLNGFYDEKDQLMNNKFETKKQIYSFLAGVYYRYGEKLDSSIYKIQLANSPKHENCYTLLKQVNCENIFYQYLNGIPAQFKLYFEATGELKNYLDIIEPERLILRESQNNQVAEIMKEHMTKDEINLYIQKVKDKEFEKIKKAFDR